MNLLNRVHLTPQHEEMYEEYREGALQLLEEKGNEEIREYFERTLKDFPQEWDNIMQNEGRFCLLLVLLGVFQVDPDPISSYELFI